MAPVSSFSRSIALSLLGLCALALLVGVVQLAVKPASTDGETDQQERPWSSWMVHHDRLLLIELAGPITMDSPQESAALFASESAAVRARKALDKALKDDSVKGVLIRIDSPGGTVAMSQELYAAVMRLRAVKPVVAALGDVAASGGYYTACAADEIVANPGSLTGSIGVILNTLNVKGLVTDRLGIRPITIKSGVYKDMLSPFREPTTAERTLLQNLVNTSYQQFLNAVLTGRTYGMKDAARKADLARRIRAVADGRVVVGSEAKAAGLVDEIGDLQHAQKRLMARVRAHYGLSARADLPLEEASAQHGLISLLGLGESAGTRESAMLPLSLRYPRQPLWLME